MVHITRSAVILSIIIAPAVQASTFSFDNNLEELARREESNELLYRRHHIHLPKVHLPHINGKKILDGLKKYGPKIGKAVFKLAKMILREDIEEGYLASRDIDGAEDLYELLARSPNGSWKKLLKTVKKMKKYVKAGAKLAQSLEGAVGGSVQDFASRGIDDDWESELVERAFDELEVLDARDLYVQLAVLERAIVEVAYEEREWDSNEAIRAREGQEIYARDKASEMYFGRHYNDLGLEDLD